LSRSSNLGDVFVPASRSSNVIYLVLRQQKESPWVVGTMMLQASYPLPISTTRKPHMLIMWLSLSTFVARQLEENIGNRVEGGSVTA
jgi:hypothetical protein